MNNIKIFLIKLRFRIISLIWIIFKFIQFKRQMSKKFIYGISVFKLSLWSSEVHFFTGQKGNTNLFIKLYKSKDKNIREAQMLLQIHNNKPCSYVPILYEYSLSNDGFILMIEKLDGFPLAKRMSDLNFEVFDDILEQFTEILEDLHNKSIVHCDIRPDNILLSNINKIKIIDFEYAVCKKIDTLQYLHFEKKHILKNLGAHYAVGDFVWDDAYSFYKIACEIIVINNYSENELTILSNKIRVLKMYIGKNQYAY